MFECQRMERRREHRAEISWVTEKGGLYGPTSPKIQRSTINRELALLRSGFYLGYEATPPKVFRVPSFPML